MRLVLELCEGEPSCAKDEAKQLAMPPHAFQTTSDGDPPFFVISSTLVAMASTMPSFKFKFFPLVL